MNTLICTLGTAAPVISETLVSLKLGKKIVIDRLHIIHTSSPEVFNKKIGAIDIGLSALKRYIKKKYPVTQMKLHALGKTDIFTSEDNDELLNMVVNIISKEKKAGNKIYISIAGGRKTMSAIALFAAYLYGCDGIYHVLVKGDEFKMTSAYGFDIPSEYLTLIKLPDINLSTILSSTVEDLFENEKSFYDGTDISTLLETLNHKLADNINIRRLKEEYDQLHGKYSQMCNAVESILISRCSNPKLNILHPMYDNRVKTFGSMIGKIIVKKEYNNETVIDPFRRFNDIAGVRVICYFKEDAKEICRIIKEGNDFNILTPKRKVEAFGYNADHFIVTLKGNRTSLIEYKILKNIKCEIQVKTIFSHAWSQIEHRLKYKSPEFKSFNVKEQKYIENVFAAGFAYLNSAEQNFSKLKKYYKNL